MTGVVIDIGQGLGIDEETLNTIVLDADVVRPELAQSEDPADRVVAALETGVTRPAAEQLSSVESPGFRITARGALQLRRALGAPPDQLESSPLALRRARADHE